MRPVEKFVIQIHQTKVRNMSERLEQIGGEYGVMVRYTLHENRLSVAFYAAEIIGKMVDPTPGQLLYGRKDGSAGDTSNFDEAERYVDGFVKWDGCAHYYFGDESGYLHLCGPESVTKLSDTLRVIFERCGEIMQEAGTETLPGEFAIPRVASDLNLLNKPK